MILPLVVRLEAEQEFDEAVSWYSEKASTEWAHRFMSAVHEAFDEIQAHPERYNFHRLEHGIFQLKLFPYDIHYLEELDRITVIAVFHRRRDDRTLEKRL